MAARLALSLVTAFLALAPTLALAESAEVGRLLDEGRQLRRARRDQDALEVFKKAFALSPTPKVKGMLGRGTLALPFRDMVWFEDRVYCTHDYGLWEIVGNQVGEASAPDEVRACSGHLYVADDAMLLAGPGGAAVRRDGRWTVLVLAAAFAKGQQAPTGEAQGG